MPRLQGQHIPSLTSTVNDCLLPYGFDADSGFVDDKCHSFKGGVGLFARSFSW